MNTEAEHPSALPTAADLAAARQRLRDVVHRTPVMTSSRLDRELGCELVFKCEHLQKTGAFKYRGASNAVLQLPDNCPGVATHSSGNHGAALAAAAALRGIAAHIVMPENAVPDKVEAVRAYGGEVHFCAPNQSAREAGLAALVEQGHEPIPPYDDNRIIAGQGTAAAELFEQASGLNRLVVPVGGGGLISGSCLAVAATEARVTVHGAEPAGAADTADSLQLRERITQAQPDTICDGLRALVGVRNFAIIQQQVESVLTVDDTQTLSAMGRLWRTMKQLVEPSGAVGVAAVMANPALFADQRVGVIVSGGNLAAGELLRCYRQYLGR